jgi:hypothetical protein
LGRLLGRKTHQKLWVKMRNLVFWNSLLKGWTSSKDLIGFLIHFLMFSAYQNKVKDALQKSEDDPNALI